MDIVIVKYVIIFKVSQKYSDLLLVLVAFYVVARKLKFTVVQERTDFHYVS